MGLQHGRSVRNKTLAVSSHQQDECPFRQAEIQQSLTDRHGLIRNPYFQEPALEARRRVPYRGGLFTRRQRLIDLQPSGYDRDGRAL